MLQHRKSKGKVLIDHKTGIKIKLILYSIIVHHTLSFKMDHHHQVKQKVLTLARKNQATLSQLRQILREKKSQQKQVEDRRLEQYRTEYDSLLRLNADSEEESFRLKKQIALLDVEIEQLELKNTLSRSRIKLQSQEIQNLKDETTNEHKQQRRKLQRAHRQLIQQLSDQQQEVELLESELENQKRENKEKQQAYQQLLQHRQDLQSAGSTARRERCERVERLQAELLSLRSKVAVIRQRRQEQEEKTKRNNKAQTLNEIWGMLRRHKQTYKTSHSPSQ